MWPLALASGHDRYIAVIPERKLVSVGVWEWPLHIIICRSHFKCMYNRFDSETVMQRPFQKQNSHLDQEVV
jgi:hypothetical protein